MMTVFAFVGQLASASVPTQINPAGPLGTPGANESPGAPGPAAFSGRHGFTQHISGKLDKTAGVLSGPFSVPPIALTGSGSAGAASGLGVTPHLVNTRTPADHAKDRVNAAEYGVSPEASAAANTAGLNAALATGRLIELIEGVYQVNGTLNVSGAGLIGRGPRRTVIYNTTANLPTINIIGNGGLVISDLAVERAKNEILYGRDVVSTAGPGSSAMGLTVTAGGDGIVVAGYTSYVTIRNVTSRWNFNNFSLGPTNSGELDGLESYQALNDGFTFNNGAYNSAATVEMQWKFTGKRSLSTLSGRDGYNVIATPGGSATQITLSDWDGIQTFGNSRNGVALLGTSALTIQGLRLHGAFIGGDGANEIYLDSYGGKHVINASFIELAANYGLIATSSNTGLRVIGGTFSGAQSNCLNSASQSTDIDGTMFENGGLNTGLSASARSNVLLTGADSSLRSFISTGGTYAAIITGARGAVMTGTVRAAAKAPLSVASDTFVRSIRAFNARNAVVTVPDAN